MAKSRSLGHTDLTVAKWRHALMVGINHHATLGLRDDIDFNMAKALRDSPIRPMVDRHMQREFLDILRQSLVLIRKKR